MVFNTLVNSLWDSLTNMITVAPTQVQRAASPVQNEKTIPFPQGAQLLNLRENKNIRGLPYLTMSSPNIDKAQYIETINKKKRILEKVSQSSMNQNLKNVEGFNTPSCIDRDAEYYRNINKINRVKQVAEQNRFYCLTGKDTYLSEANTYLFKGLPYNQYTKPNNPEIVPWELQNMGVKTAPSVLCDVKLINETDKHILENF